MNNNILINIGLNWQNILWKMMKSIVNLFTFIKLKAFVFTIILVNKSIGIDVFYKNI